MSLSPESEQDDHQLVRYLLGQLSDEDAERVDQLSIVDDEVAWRVRAVEDDLVDAYVRGTLAGDTLQRFESFYLSSPFRREKVRFAETFRRHIDAAAAPADTEARHDPIGAPAAPQGGLPSRGSRWFEWVFPRSRYRWILVAAGLLLLACGALLIQGFRLRHELTEAQRQRAALGRRAQELTQQLEDQRSAWADADKELRRARASMAELTQRSSAAPPSGADAPASRALSMLALVLLPQTRAAGPTPTLAVPTGRGGVAFALRLESNDFARYHVALKDPATHHILWRSNAVAARTAGDVPTVSVIVPASVLKPQQYSLELTGDDVAGGAQLVGSYTVRIVPQ